jgi:hypothetical protein
VGEVGLPHLIRQFRGEPHIGRFRFLLRLRDEQPSLLQGAPDRGRRHLKLMLLGQMPGNGVRAGIQALPGQLAAQPDDQLNRGLGQR